MPGINDLISFPGRKTWSSLRGLALGASLAITSLGAPDIVAAEDQAVPPSAAVLHQIVEIDGVDIFYREGGDPAQPTVLLLHGFPTSSQMFRNLIPVLGERYHVLAPDYPGYGASAMPAREDFDYTFAKMADLVDGFLEAKNVDRYSVYLRPA